jgi:hypothetical protein
MRCSKRTDRRLGAPQDVYFQCNECIEKANPPQKNCILDSSCELPAMVPACNVWAMRKAVNYFDW